MDNRARALPGYIETQNDAHLKKIRATTFSLGALSRTADGQRASAINLSVNTALRSMGRTAERLIYSKSSVSRFNKFILDGGRSFLNQK
jgi:hypothetical protein